MHPNWLRINQRINNRIEQKEAAGRGHDILAPKPEETHLNPPLRASIRNQAGAREGRKEEGDQQAGRRETREVLLLIEGREWNRRQGKGSSRVGFLFSPPPGAPLLSFRYSPPPLPLGARL